jgi:hypothetical protein
MQRILSVSISLLFTVIAFGQAAIQNNGNLYINTGANMAAFGHFTNTNTAALVNDGTFYIKGNIANNQASMSAGTGTTHLNGTTSQSVDGTQIFKTYNLNTNNSNGITLNNNLSVTAAHTFSAGIIATSATPNYLVYEAGSSYSGSADNAHVNGWVKKIGSTGFSFPVGSATVLRAIAISSLSGSSEYNAQFVQPTTNTSNVASPLVTVDPYEYWLVNQVSGGTAVVDMNWNNSKVTFPNYLLASIRVANYAGGLWTSRGGTAAGNVTTTGTISSTTTGSFGAFTFGSLNFSLPLDFIDITAKRNDDYSLVQWKTAEEYNVDHFEVERKDGRSNGFYMIGQVAAHNGVSNDYEIEDHLALDGTAYYRVRSVDRDGQFNYTKIVAVSDKLPGSMTVLNNPARSTIFISVNNVPKGNYVYQLLDGSGKIVQAGQVLIEGQSVIDIPVSIKASKGFYVVKVRNGLFEFADKLIIQ